MSNGRRFQPALADPHELLQNCLRLLLGVVKIALIAPLVYKAWDELQVGLVNHRVEGWKFLVEFPVVFYPAIRSICTAISPVIATSSSRPIASSA